MERCGDVEETGNKEKECEYTCTPSHFHPFQGSARRYD